MGPAFVQWRYGADYVGWAPLPPDEVIVDYRDRADVWSFCRARDFGAPLLTGVIIGRNEYPAFFRETVVLNETVLLRDRRHFAVNPGIPAAFIAAAIGRPLHTYAVQPRILAGTGQVPNATVVGAQQLQALRHGGQNRNFGAQASLRETSQTIAPARGSQQLRPLAAGERGRLGDNPPLAAQGPGTQQPQPLAQQRPGQQQQRQGQRQQTAPSTQGAGSPRAREEDRGPQDQQQGRREAQPGTRDRQVPQTQGRSSERQLREEGNRAVRPTPEIRASERSRQTDTERRAARPQQRPTTEGRRQVAPEPAQPRAGRSGLESGRASVRPEPRPERRSAPSATEGRGGGFGAMSAPHPAVGGGGGGPHAAPMGGGAARAPMGGGQAGGGVGGHGHGR